MERKLELDLCRIFSCFMVVMLHVVATGWNTVPTLCEWKIFNFLSTSVTAGVPIFFMISGALFLEKTYFNIKKFLIKNTSRLILIYIVWSIIYELINQYITYCYSDIIQFFSGVVKGHYHLWFLPAMAMIYLFLPVIHSAIKKSGGVDPEYIMIFLYFIILKTNILLIPDIPELIGRICNKVDISQISYLGYVVLGYILSSKNYYKKICLFLMPVVYFLTTVLTAYGNYWYSLRVGEKTGWLSGGFSLPVFIQACCVFIFFQCLKDMKIKASKILIYISDCTLGIYLLHPMILEFYGRHGFSVSSHNPIKSVILLYLSVIGICFIATSILRRIPFVRKVI